VASYDDQCCKLVSMKNSRKRAAKLVPLGLFQFSVAKNSSTLVCSWNAVPSMSLFLFLLYETLLL
jgi:hypothetical protein